MTSPADHEAAAPAGRAMPAPGMELLLLHVLLRLAAAAEEEGGLAEVTAVEEEEEWRRDLDCNSSFSWSRSFWICFFSMSERLKTRLKTRLPPVASTTDWRFFQKFLLQEIHCVSRALILQKLNFKGFEI